MAAIAIKGLLTRLSPDQQNALYDLVNTWLTSEKVLPLFHKPSIRLKLYFSAFTTWPFFLLDQPAAAWSSGLRPVRGGRAGELRPPPRRPAAPPGERDTPGQLWRRTSIIVLFMVRCRLDPRHWRWWIFLSCRSPRRRRRKELTGCSSPSSPSSPSSANTAACWSSESLMKHSAKSGVKKSHTCTCWNSELNCNKIRVQLLNTYIFHDYLTHIPLRPRWSPPSLPPLLGLADRLAAFWPAVRRPQAGGAVGCLEGGSDGASATGIGHHLHHRKTWQEGKTDWLPATLFPLR